MTYIIAKDCVDVMDGACVDVCPVDCIYSKPGDNQLFISPDECIDCTLCVAECPEEAIYADDDVPDDQKDFIELNAELAKAWPSITERKDAPVDASEWQNKPNKRDLLER